MANLLFIDDDPAIIRINRIFFEARDNQVFTAESLDKAFKVLEKNNIECIVLDILMPEVDGFQACLEIKNKYSIPIIFLTSLNENECLYRGFNLGGDDYLTKPYDLRELEARIKARLKQYKSTTCIRETLSFPPMTIDTGGRQVLIEGKPIQLTAHEFDILLLLAKNPGKVFSMEDIYKEVWNLPDLGNAQTVRVHLARMRHKLEKACPNRIFISLVWGKGFLFKV